jgi:hypothetical protein
MPLARSSNRSNTFRSLPGDRGIPGFAAGVNRAISAVRRLDIGKYLGGHPLPASLTTALTGTNNDLKFTAVTPGAAGNSITVTYVDPPTNNATLSVDVDGTDITVNLATNGSSAVTSTAAQVAAAIAASVEASRLVSVENAPSNDGSGVVTALAETALSGGASLKAYADAPSQA